LSNYRDPLQIYKKFIDFDINKPVDLIVASLEIIEKYKNITSCILNPALKEGIVIYE